MRPNQKDIFNLLDQVTVSDSGEIQSFMYHMLTGKTVKLRKFPSGWLKDNRKLFNGKSLPMGKIY